MKSMYLVFTSKINMALDNLFKLKLVNEYSIIILNSKKSDEYIDFTMMCSFFYVVSMLVVEKNISILNLK